MMGSDVSPGSLGVIPCAIAWLFHLIQEQQRQQHSTARYSVRVSAVEVQGRDENLRDLLSAEAGSGGGSGASAAVYLREDPISGAQLENQSELRAPTAEKAAHYLDAALYARSQQQQQQNGMSHLLFTLHLYQYRVERSGHGRGVAGGRSRLHLIDLGSGRTSRDAGHSALSLAALGSVLMSLVNGQRHIPHRDSKLSQLLREALGSLTCRACMICQVSSGPQHSTESLQILQLANKIQRLRRRGGKLTSNSSDSSSCDSFGVRRAGRMRPPQMGLVMASAAHRLNAVTSQSEVDYSSSSEQSCDTVIFAGGYMTDNEHPPGAAAAAVAKRLAQVSSSEDSDTGTETGGSGGGSGRRVPRTNARARPSLGGRLVGKLTAVEALSLQREQWIDGPKAMQTPIQAPVQPSHVQPAANLASVIKVPKEAVPPACNERWIDGPNASPPTTEERHHRQEPTQSLPSAPQPPSPPEPPQLPPPLPVKPPEPQRKDAETQSEEPYESESSASTYSTLERGNQRVLSDISEKTEDTSGKSGQDGEEEDDSGATEQQLKPPSPPKTADLDEESTNNEVLEQIEIPSAPPSPAVLVSSSTGERTAKRHQQLTPQPPAPLHHQRQGLSSLPRLRSTPEVPELSNPSAVSTGSRIKPFVRDWVEKHSGLSGSESCDCSTCDEQCSKAEAKARNQCRKKQQQQQQCQSACSSPVHTLLQSDRPASLQTTPTHHIHSQQSPNATRHRSRSSKRSAQQPVAPPPSLARVAQWLQGVEPDDLCRAVAAAAASVSLTSTQQTAPATVSSPPPSSCSLATSAVGPQKLQQHHHLPQLQKLAPELASATSIASTPTPSHRRASSSLSSSEATASPCVADGASGRSSSTSTAKDKEASVTPGRRAASKLASFLNSPLFGKRSSKSSPAHQPQQQPTQPLQPQPVRVAVAAAPASTSTSVRKRRGDSHRSTAAASATTAVAPVVIPSPYHTVTQPRASVHSSSGHGSDCSYNPLGAYGGVGARRRWGGVPGGASSGYESMLRDSEASSCHDTASEQSGPSAGTKIPVVAGIRSGTRRKPTHHQHRKSGGNRSRSRSAPSAEQGEEAEGDDNAADSASKVDAEAGAATLEEEREEMEWQIRCEKVNELLCHQDQLKKEMLQAKGLLMADPSSWNFDLHVAESMDPESPGFLEALRKETSILRKRVHACKSHLMFVSCFDAKGPADGDE